MRQKALIDINTLLDTRLGVLARLNSAAANSIVRSDWYPIRDTDRFDRVSDGVISKEMFDEMYNKFEVETLSNSLMTNLIYILRSDVKDIFPKYQLKEINGKITFDINVYPYRLLDEEKEIIKRAISHYLTEPASVNVVDIAYHLLTPTGIALNYDMMTIYNYEDWLKYHHEALLTNPIEDFTIFYPRIAPSGIVPEPNEIAKDPFMVIPMALCRHLQMHPVPTSWVSWNPKVYKRLINRPPGMHLDSTVVHPESIQSQISRHSEE